MKCANFASWVLLMTSIQAHETRSLLRAGEAMKTRSLKSAWESEVSERSFDDINHNVVLAGIIHHGAEISTNSITFMLKATCENKVRAHILGADDMVALSAMYDRLKEDMYPETYCAPLTVISQPAYVTAEKGRINRIQAARDYQRIAIAEHYDFADLDKATIILADFDVNKLPPLDQVVGKADKMNSRSDDVNVDVLCASGMMHNPYGYYDTFATVLLPDTFVYPVNGRPGMKARPEEDASMIIDNNFTSHQLLDWFHKEGGPTAKPVPVKSCFGGLAIYRASRWLDQRCSYKDNHPELNAKYVNRFDMAPCEHVVLHNCMQAVDPDVVVAVQPDMHTLWHASNGPSYALSTYPDLASDFLRAHLELMPSHAIESRHLSIDSANFTNSTGFNSTDSYGIVDYHMHHLLKEIFIVNCTNATDGYGSPVDSNCTDITHEKRMTGINDLIRFLYDGPVNCNSATEDCSRGFDSLIQLIYDDADSQSDGNSANCTDTNCTTSNSTMEYDRDLELDVIPDLKSDVVQDQQVEVPDQKVELQDRKVDVVPEIELDLAAENTVVPSERSENMVADALSDNSEAIVAAIHDAVLSADSEVVEDVHIKRTLDFFIAGFPKCGTTSLLYTFKNNTETSIGQSEQCAIGSTGISDGEAFDLLDLELSLLSQDPTVKKGIKCPVGISNSRALDRLDQHSPEAKLLIGMRHPVEYFQSYYNYRITEMYDHNLPLDSIPAAESLVGENEWLGVSTDTARFELYLMQLAKTDVSIDDLEDMESRAHLDLAVKPNKFRIFLYTLDQMDDKTEERKESFRQQMRTFLDLSLPLQDMERANTNTFVGEFAHKETIEICASKYDDLRAMLVEQGKKSQQWIRDEFIHSPDVVVGNKDHFLAILDTWSHDPCSKSDVNVVSPMEGFWMYIKSFIEPLFNLVESFFY